MSVRPPGVELIILGPADHDSFDRAHQTLSKPNPFEMSRKYLIFATIALALAAAHAEEGPKVTHKVRAGEARGARAAT